MGIDATRAWSAAGTEHRRKTRLETAGRRGAGGKREGARPDRTLSTVAGRPGGSARGSVEMSVTDLERKGWLI